jgi:hypothetical protein
MKKYFFDFSAPTELTRSGSAELQVEFAHWDPVEHGVETGSLEHIDFRNLHYFGYFPHGAQTEEIVILFLGQHQEGDATRPFVVRGEVTQYLFHFQLVFGSKFENV